MPHQVRLGYEVGTGREVAIPILNMVVTGQTQQAGKTTALEGLIHRAGVPALAFVTKRGERSFKSAPRVDPYFRERADWQFVASVLEAILRERMKFERAWIMRACKGAKTLADVQKNIRGFLADNKVRGINADVYTTLDAYLDIVVPKIATVRFAQKLVLKPGLNVLDLSDRDTFPPQLQGLVIRSAVEWVHEKLAGVVTIIPEAWEFIPQSRGSPVKHAAVELVRKGSALGNYLWIDSQDIAGVDKELLRQCPVWLLGVQREANEIKRVLASIPAGIAKPKASEIATLDRGQFYACFGSTVAKVYAQPRWMQDDEARRFGRDALLGSAFVPVPVVPPPAFDEPEQTPGPTDPVPPIEPTDPMPGDDDLEDQEDEMTPEQEKKLDKVIDMMGALMPLVGKTVDVAGATYSTEDGSRLAPPVAALGNEKSPGVYSAELVDEDALYERFKARLAAEAPALLRVLTMKNQIDVEVQVNRISTNSQTCHGMLAVLLSEGYFDEVRTASAAWKEIGRRFGYKGANVRAYEQMDVLHKQGFVTKESDGYKAVPGMKVNIIDTTTMTDGRRRA